VTITAFALGVPHSIEGAGPRLSGPALAQSV
jgi:hypothetical protein